MNNHDRFSLVSSGFDDKVKQNLDLEYVILSLIDVNDTSLDITFNTISEFWSVTKIMSNKSS